MSQSKVESAGHPGHAIQSAGKQDAYYGLRFNTCRAQQPSVELTQTIKHAYWYVCYELIEDRVAGHPGRAIQSARESAY